MKYLGFLILIIGLSMMIGFVITGIPASVPVLVDIETDLGAAMGMALAIVGSLFFVGGMVTAEQSHIIHMLQQLPENLNKIENHLSGIKISAKHSVQEFLPKEKVEDYNGYEIFYKNRFFYILGVNAKFFTREGAENWIDKTQERVRKMQLQ